MKIDTQCVHSGTIIDETVRGINTPIYTSSAYEYLSTGSRIYPRYFNTPNQRAVTGKLIALEECEDGVLFSSGMAAVSTVMITFLKPGDHAVIQDDIYGGAHAMVTDLLAERGIDFTFAAADAAEIIKAVTPRTRLVYIESPTNPLLTIIDIQKIGEHCGTSGVVSVIDNTFASPINQKPSNMGIDIIVHSGTKYLSGHSDLCCGAVCGRKDLIAKVAKVAINLGGSLNAESCYLLERSMKTLALRVRKQTENAGIIAGFLSKHPKVDLVNYPGLPQFKNHEIARSQMSGFGAVLSFAPATGTAHEFMRRLQLITPALSLGGVETTICDPATTSHQKVSAEVRKRLGISDRLMRLSAGIEDPADLIGDIDRALL